MLGKCEGDIIKLRWRWRVLIADRLTEFPAFLRKVAFEEMNGGIILKGFSRQGTRKIKIHESVVSFVLLSSSKKTDSYCAKCLQILKNLSRERNEFLFIYCNNFNVKNNKICDHWRHVNWMQKSCNHDRIWLSSIEVPNQLYFFI